MRVLAWTLAASLIAPAAVASSNTADRKGPASSEITVKSIVLDEGDFTAQVKNLPDDYKEHPDCKCTTAVRVPEFAEFPSSAIHTINDKLRAIGQKNVIDDKTNYDNCQASSFDYTIPAANQSFVSVRLTSGMSCGAYPVSTSEGISFDARTGEQLEWVKLVDQKKLPLIEAACKKQYKDILKDPQENESVANAPEPDETMFSFKDKDIANSFVITQDKKLVLMLDEKFWPHVVGSIDCVVPKAALTPAFNELFGSKGVLE